MDLLIGLFISIILTCLIFKESFLIKRAIFLLATNSWLLHLLIIFLTYWFSVSTAECSSQDTQMVSFEGKQTPVIEIQNQLKHAESEVSRSQFRSHCFKRQLNGLREFLAGAQNLSAFGETPHKPSNLVNSQIIEEIGFCEFNITQEKQNFNIFERRRQDLEKVIPFEIEFQELERFARFFEIHVTAEDPDQILPGWFRENADKIHAALEKNLLKNLSEDLVSKIKEIINAPSP